MQWLRWYRGTVEDAKFRYIARSAKCTISEVIAAWAVLLEDAASDEHRGCVTRDGAWIASILDLDDGLAERILDQMQRANMVELTNEGIKIRNWDSRQFQSDTDKTAAERQKRRRQRVKESHADVTRDASVSHGPVTAPDTDTDTDTDSKKDSGNKDSPPSTPKPNFQEDLGFQALVTAWNDELSEPHGLPRVTRLTKARYIKFKAREKDYGGWFQVYEILTKINNQPFLLGKNQRGWKANFDWFLEPRNMARIEEGNYTNGHA
jgi:hypothetical protein